MNEIDETMSNEQAFDMDKVQQDDVFNFDDDVQKGNNSDEDTSSSPVGNEEESEQKVPYSRFKRKTEEASARIRFLEEQLQEVAASKAQAESETPEMPPEWIELYGNSEASTKAWNVQVKLDTKRMENMLSAAQRQEEEQQRSLIANEEIIDDTLMELQEKRGIKLTQKMEDAILDIVDRYSPVGPDGKYIQMFPFEDALEIYENQQGSKIRSTQNARTQIANLTGNIQAGDVNDSGLSQKRGWDAWRETLL